MNQQQFWEKKWDDKKDRKSNPFAKKARRRKHRPDHFVSSSLLGFGQAATCGNAFLGGLGSEALALTFILAFARGLGSCAIRSALAGIDAIAVNELFVRLGRRSIGDGANA